MDKREKLFDTLNNHFGERNVFLEFNQIADEDINKIIEMYEEEASKDGKDPWGYTHFDDLIIMQKCVYLVIKDNVKYNQITDKIEMLFLQELNRRLQRRVYEYGEPTNEFYRAPYTEMGEYSIILADMCARHLNGTRNYIDNLNALPIVDYENMISTYEDIKSDFLKVDKQMPKEQEQTVLQAKEIVNHAKNSNGMKINYTQGEMASRYVGGIPREPAIEPVWGAENNREANLNSMQERKTETPVYTEAEKQDIREQMRQAQEQLAQTLEWAEQQPNEVEVTSLGGNTNTNTTALPNDSYIHNDDLENYINTNFSHLGKVDKILSVSGYPVSYYEVRFDNGEVHSIPDKRGLNETNNNQDELKNNLVNELIENGLASGEITEFSPLPDIKNRLMEMPVEELQNTLATMQQQNEQIQSGGMHR